MSSNISGMFGRGQSSFGQPKSGAGFAIDDAALIDAILQPPLHGRTLRQAERLPLFGVSAQVEQRTDGPGQPGPAQPTLPAPAPAPARLTLPALDDPPKPSGDLLAFPAPKVIHVPDGPETPTATAGSELTPGDPSAAADFLCHVAAPAGLVAVAAIIPNGRMEGHTFDLPREQGALVAWIAERESRANLYFTVNEPVPATLQKGKNGKLTKADVASVRGVFVDLDPKDDAAEFATERARLFGIADDMAAMGAVAPTYVVDSGNGIQAVWLFPEPFLVTANVRDRAEKQGKALREKFSGDTVHNLDRLMRVPFTTNLPDAGKRARGRVASPARVLHVDWSQRTTLEALAQFAPPVASTLPDKNRKDELPDLTGIEAVIHTPENLPDDLRARLERLVASDGPAAGLANAAREAPRGARSDADFALACRLAELGIAEFVDLAFALAAYGSSKVDERGSDYIERTVTRSLLRVGEARHLLDDIPDDAGAATASPAAVDHRPEIDFVAVTGPIDARAIPVRRHVVSPRYPLGEATAVVGEPGVSKSTLLLQDALAIVTGDERILRGEEGASPDRLHMTGPAVYYNAEDSLDEMQRRLAAMQAHYGIDVLKHPIYLYSGKDSPPIRVMERKGQTARSRLEVHPSFRAFMGEVARVGAVFVVLDPFADLCAGADENDNADMHAVMSTLSRTASEFGVAIAVAQHTAKSTRNNPGDMGAARGGFATAGAVRASVTLCEVSAKDAEEWRLPPGDYVRLDYAKASHERKERAPIVYRRVSVSVGNGSSLEALPAESMALSPAEQRQVFGDTAPVLEIVKTHTAPREAAAAEQRAKAEDQATARVVLEVLNGKPREALRGLLPELGKKLRGRGIIRAKSEVKIREHVTASLGTSGIVVERDGQNVCVKVEKVGEGDRAPWFLVVKPAGPQEPDIQAEPDVRSCPKSRTDKS